jgi:hypothetical protein
MVFASGFPADGVKRRDSAVPFNCAGTTARGGYCRQARFLDLSVYEQTNHAAVV